MLPLPKTKDSSSPKIVFIRHGLENADLANVMKVHLMISDILLLEDDNIIISGQYIVQDMKLMTLTSSRMFSPSIVKKAMTCFQTAFPFRPKGVLFININSFFELINNIFKPFLSEKLKKRVICENTYFTN